MLFVKTLKSLNLYERESCEQRAANRVVPRIIVNQDGQYDDVMTFDLGSGAAPSPDVATSRTIVQNKKKQSKEPTSVPRKESVAEMSARLLALEEALAEDQAQEIAARQDEDGDGSEHDDTGNEDDEGYTIRVLSNASSQDFVQPVVAKNTGQRILSTQVAKQFVKQKRREWESEDCSYGEFTTEPKSLNKGTNIVMHCCVTLPLLLYPGCCNVYVVHMMHCDVVSV